MIRLITALVFLISAQAFALPVGMPSDFRPSENFGFDTISYDFEGIIALSNCSGSLIRLKDSRDSDPAMVLTNGHCIGTMPEPGEVITNRDSTRSMDILDAKTARSIGSVTATKILYSTMTRTDMTIYVLKQTYSEILSKYNVRARVLADRYPSIGEEIEVISGYWRIGYSCAVEAIIPTLREDAWTMNESILYSRPGCHTKGGTSGSPILSVKTGEVIGVNNTGNEDGEKCTMNNPCEVDADGNISYEKGRSYGQQTSWLYTCLVGRNQLDLNRAGCKLAK